MRTFILLAFICMLSTACRLTRTSGYTNNPANIAVIKVEFRNEDALRLTIIQVLKTSRVMEMETSHHGSSEIITAKYDNTPGGKVAEIEQTLTQTAGVIEVTVKWEEIPGAAPSQAPQRFAPRNIL
jgi:rRNA maturation protein Rpf1